MDLNPELLLPETYLGAWPKYLLNVFKTDLSFDFISARKLNQRKKKALVSGLQRHVRVIRTMALRRFSTCDEFDI